MTMTVNDVARVLGVDSSTVRRHIRKLFPDLPENGKQTFLDENQVTRIKQAIQNNGRTDLEHLGNVTQVTTDLEMMERAHSVLSWMAGKVQILQEENDRLRPIAAAHQILTDSEGACTMAELAKNIGMGEYKLFGELRDADILITGGPSHNLPFQEYMDRGWFRVRAINIPRTKGSDLKRQTLITPKGQSEIAKLFTRQLEAT